MDRRAREHYEEVPTLRMTAAVATSAPGSSNLAELTEGKEPR
jgi:hypothetical protein